jgi:DNA-binding XRE family transcriptional regulator
MDYASMIAQLGTDQEAAKKLGIHRASVSKLRRGKSVPRWKTVQKLLDLQKQALAKRVRK